MVGVGGGPGVDINKQMVNAGMTPSPACGHDGQVPFRRYAGSRPVVKSACGNDYIVYELHLDGDVNSPMAATAFYDPYWNPLPTHC